MTLNEQIQAGRIAELEEELRESEEDNCLLKIENNTSSGMINVLKKQLQAYMDALDPNETKSAYIGEHSISETMTCVECYGYEEPDDDCDICQGSGDYRQEFTIDWTTTKDIMKMISDRVKRNIE